MNKIYPVIIALLLLVIAGGAYKFAFQGEVRNGLSVDLSTDGREVVNLKMGERDLVLEEMRGFLSSVQQILKGLAEDDMKRVADAARKVGRAAQAEMPATLGKKLPMEFKKLGHGTHMKFDQLAMDAEDLEDASQTLSQLATLMENCVACHAMYRFDVSGE